MTISIGGKCQASPTGRCQYAWDCRFCSKWLKCYKRKMPGAGRDTQQIINALPVCIAKQERAGVMVLHVIYRKKIRPPVWEHRRQINFVSKQNYRYLIITHA